MASVGVLISRQTKAGVGGQSQPIEHLSDVPLKFPAISPRGTPRDDQKHDSGCARPARTTTRQLREDRQIARVKGYLGAMHCHADLAAVQEESIVALCQIVNMGQLAGIRTMVRSGGLSAIIHAMQTHSGRPDLQQRAASALFQVAGIDNACQRAIVDAGGAGALVAAVAAHAEERPGAADRSCAALAAIASGDGPCKEACVHAGAVHAVVTATSLHPRMVTLQANGCAVLSMLSAGNEACKQALVEEGGLVAINRALDNHGTADAVMAHACMAIHRLSTGSVDVIDSLVQTGCVRAIQMVLRRYPTQTSLAHLIICTLANVTYGGVAACEEVASTRCLSVLIPALNRHVHKAPIAERGLASICNLLSGGQKMIDRVLRSGALEVLRNIAGAHRRRVAVIEQACLSLTNAATGDLETKAFIIRHNAVQDVIMGAMHELGHCDRVQEACCAALANLAAGTECADDESPLNASAVPITTKRESNICNPLADHLSQKEATSRPNTSLSRSRPGTSQDTSADTGVSTQQLADNNRSAIIEADALPAVVAAMNSHAGCMSVQEEAIAFMRNMAAGGHHCCEAIVQSNGPAVIVRSMNDFASMESLCELGCLAFRNIGCGSAQHLHALIEAGAIPTVVQALKAHMPSSRHTLASCAALRNLAVDTWASAGNAIDGREDAAMNSSATAAGVVGAIIAADGALAVVHAMRSHMTDIAVLSQGCGALRNLACGARGDPYSRVLAAGAIVDAGGVLAISEAMRAHPAAKGLQVHGCAAFRNLADGHEPPQVLGQLIANRSIEAVLAAMQLHHEDADVQLQACALLANAMQIGSRPSEVPEVVWSAHCSDVKAAAVHALAGGAMERIGDALRRYISSLPITAQACTGLSSILSRSPSTESIPSAAQHLMETDSAFAGLSNAIICHPNEEAIIRPACACLIFCRSATNMQSEGTFSLPKAEKVKAILQNAQRQSIITKLTLDKLGIS